MKRFLSCALCIALMITMSSCCCSFLYEQEKTPSVSGGPTTATTAPKPNTDVPADAPTEEATEEIEEDEELTVQGTLTKESDGYYLLLSPAMTVGEEYIEKLQVEIDDEDYEAYCDEFIIITGGFTKTHVGKHVLKNCIIEAAALPDDSENEVDATLSMIDFYGLTTIDIINMYGEEYVLSDYLIGGGWRAMYYDVAVTPILFCYQSYEFQSTTCIGNERIEGVLLYPQSGSHYDINVIDGVKPTATYAEVSEALDGKFYENMLMDGYSYACEVDGPYGITFTWKDEAGTDPMEVLVKYEN